MFNVQKIASKHVIQILSVNDGRLESKASGVLCWAPIDGTFKKCLLTAGHVTKEENLATESTESNSDNPYVTMIDGNLWIKQSNSSHDWALYPLPKEHFEDLALNGRDFIPLVNRKNSGPYTFCGFPASKNKTKRGVVKTQPYSYMGSEISKEQYRAIECNPKDTIAVHFDKDDCSLLGDSLQRSFPDPEGMSGGAIFDSFGLLAGIITDLKAQQKALVGIQTVAILDDLTKGKF